MKKFIGVDLHKQLIVVCAVNQARQIIARERFHCRDLDRIVAWFAEQGRFEMVVEATASYEWFVALIEPHAERVVLAHPAKLRVIAQSTRKSDKLDARVLAEFLALDMIPPAYRPTPRQHEHRRLVRYRHHLRGRITSLKNRIRNVLADYNADRKDVFTIAGREYARQVVLRPADRFVLDDLWLTLDHYYQRLCGVEQALKEFARSASAPEAQARRLLQTIPGVGPTTIEIFLAELADVRRFGSQKKVTAYAGLAPGQRESGGRCKALGITHTGSGLLRWVLNQASWQLVRREARWQRIFEALAKRRGKKKAITAVSRRLLCLMTSLVLNEQPYRRAA